MSSAFYAEVPAGRGLASVVECRVTTEYPVSVFFDETTAISEILCIWVFDGLICQVWLARKHFIHDFHAVMVWHT